MSAMIPGSAFIRLVAHLVPAWEREAWVAEWEGELDYYWSALERRGAATPLARAALLGRCLGAVPDALSVRRRHGGDDMLSLLARDLRLAVRTLGRRPGFVAVVVLTFALGVGANAAIFSVVNAVLLRPLPYPDPDQLIILRGAPTDGDSAKVGRSSSYPDYVDIRDAARSFTQLAAFGSERLTLSGGAGGGEATLIPAARVSANLFAALGAAPAIGRGILPEEDRLGAARAVVLSNGLWLGRFGGDPAVVGRAILLGGEPHTVVGVMPAGFRFPNEAQLWLPVGANELAHYRGKHMYGIVGRLGPGVTRERAEAEVQAIARRLEERYPQDNAKRTAVLVPMHEAVVGPVRPALLVLLGATAAVLLICCTNVANLLLVRAAAREREAAVRAALGAGRGALVRQWLSESVLLAMAGGALGLLVARWGVDALVAAAPRSIPRAAEIGVDGRVLLFLLTVSIAAGVAFGLAPALHFAWGDRSLSRLREGGRWSAGAGRGRQRLRQALVISEVALATVLVIGAGLLLKSFNQLRQVEPGFDPDHLVAVQVKLPENKYAELPKVRAFYTELLERAGRVPGVRAAAVAMEHPLSGGWTSSYTVSHEPPPPLGHEPEARVRPVMPGYFRTAGVRLLAGRDVSERDIEGAPGVVVVNEAFLRKHFPGASPSAALGHRVLRQPWWPGMPAEFEIVGVAADERFLGPQEATDPATYFPLAQFTLSDMYVLARTTGDPAAFVAALRREVAALDPDVPLDNARTMDQALGDLVAAPRFNTSLLAIFAGVALLLAALGIYGVLAYAVAQRTPEIGVRMALGAPRASVLRLVVGHGMALALAGVAAGTAAALALTRSLQHLLFDVRATDPAVFGAVALLLATVALAACYIPARRAAKVDPMVALRNE